MEVKKTNTHHNKMRWKEKKGSGSKMEVGEKIKGELRALERKHWIFINSSFG